MYIEWKTHPDGHTDRGPARIGRIFFNKSGKTLMYQGKKFQKSRAGCSNYRDIETGDGYWISGPKKNGQDRYSWASRTPVEIDEDVQEEYWIKVRNRPDKIKEKFTG